MKDFGTPTRAALQALQQDEFARRLPWLATLQREAAAQADAQGLPTIADEAWKYTDVTALSAASLRPATLHDSAALSATEFAALPLATSSHARAVLVNGGFRADLSDLSTLPAGIQVGSIGSVLATKPDTLAPILTAASTGASAFAALNTALLRDGLLIDIGAEVALDEAIHLIFVGHGQHAALMRTPRVIVRAGRHSRVRLIEEYVSAGDDPGLTNGVTELQLVEGATVHHHRLQTESERTAHIGRLTVAVGANATFVSDSIAFGGNLSRIDIDVALSGHGAACRLHGLFVATGSQHVDHHTRIDHLVSDTHSTELYRGILDGRSRGVFNGKVFVHKDAQRISALQTSNNLLLSRHAEIDTKPELEIYADDVRCTHGATIGDLDESAMFYLRSRGIGESDARALLVYAFAQKVAEHIPLPGVRRWIERRFLGHEAYGELLAEVRER